MDKKRAYTLYSLVRLLFDEAILAAIVLWLLPAFGIRIPVWLLIVLITGGKKQVHVIDAELCQKCGICRSECKFDAVQVI